MTLIFFLTFFGIFQLKSIEVFIVFIFAINFIMASALVRKLSGSSSSIPPPINVTEIPSALPALQTIANDYGNYLQYPELTQQKVMNGYLNHRLIALYRRIHLEIQWNKCWLSLMS